MQRHFAISDEVAEAAGFPQPEHGRIHRDHSGRVWVYRGDVHDGLSDLSGSWVSTLVGTGGSIGGGIIGKLIGGGAGGAIGGGIALISSLIAGIFAAHSAKVQREDQISGAWAASGPAAINTVMQAYHSGQISGSDASSALDSIKAQFLAMTQPITKLNGQFGSFPDPTQARPSSGCNWACGTSWDLSQQIAGLKSGLNTSSASGLSLGGMDPIMLGGLLVLAFMVFKK